MGVLKLTEALGADRAREGESGVRHARWPAHAHGHRRCCCTLDMPAARPRIRLRTLTSLRGCSAIITLRNYVLHIKPNIMRYWP